MRTLVLVLACTLGLARRVPAVETITPLPHIPLSGTTGEKPQSKLWFHAGHWWAVLASSVSPSGMWLWRLEPGYTWTNVLRIAAGTGFKADVKSFGDVAHVLLQASAGQLVSLEYVPALDTYMPWSMRPSATPISLSGSETATLDVDTTGRLWVSTESGSNILVYYSDSPYLAFSGPVVLANNINADDIGLVTALPFPLPSKIGVFWSNQKTKFFGFRFHKDGDPPATWSADELPASQSQQNVGGGMADDHLHATVASDGTLYVAVKTSWNSNSLPLVALLVRRPNGSWDNLYEVERGAGTRGIVLLNEDLGFLRVVYTANSGGGNIYYRDSPLSPIAFGARKTLLTGSLNNTTSTKDIWSDQLVVVASGNGVLFRETGVGPTTTSSSTSTSSTSSSSVSTTSSTSVTSTSVTTSTSTSVSTTSSTSVTSTTSSSVTTITVPPSTVSAFQEGVSGPANSANVDTYLRLSTPTSNWGSATELIVGVTNAADKVFRSVLAFDLSSIPAGATVTGCTLGVNVTQRTNPTLGHIQRLCAAHWLDGNGQSESQATWDLWKTGSSWGLAGAASMAACGSGGDYATMDQVDYTPPAGTGLFTFPDLAPLCQDALTQPGGWLRLTIRQDAESTQSNVIKFGSSDAGTASNRPRLTVTWHP